LSWQKKDKEQKSPNLLKMIARFNEVSNWVATTVLRETDTKRRASLLKKFIAIGDQLYKLKNYNGVFEITSGLVSSSVSRLSKTWEMIPTKATKRHEKNLALTSPQQNFAFYRNLLQTNLDGCVPYVGLFLQDLTFIEEGNPDHLESYVNFSKCKMVGEVIKQVQKLQKKPYNLKPLPQMQKFLLQEHTTVSEKEMFELSLTAEPREPKPV